MRNIGLAIFGLGAALALAAPALADSVLENGDRNPARTQKTYAFRCGGARDTLSLENSGANSVRLGRFDVRGAALPAPDRDQVQGALDRFAFVYDVGLRCGDADVLTLTGRGQGASALTVVVRIKQGRLVALAASDGDAAPDDAGRMPSRSEKSYAYRCGGGRYAIALAMGGPDGVRLRGFDLPQGALSAGDRRRIAAALARGRYAVTNDIGLQCGDTDLVYLGGFPSGRDGRPDTAHPLAMVLQIRHGRLVRIA